MLPFLVNLIFQIVFVGVSILIVAALARLFYRRWKGRRILERLDHQHVLITGGSQGIGKAMAVLCFKNGANVTLFARDPIKLDRAKKEILQHRVNKEQQVNCFSVDITNVNEVNKSVEFVLKMFEPVDILINCAGNSIPQHVERLEVETFEKMMSVNYFGSVYVTKALLDAMKQRQQGRIVFVSSVAGLVGLFGFSAYSPAKFAVIGFAQCLDMELRAYGINVSVVLPPDTDTPGFEQEEKSKVRNFGESFVLLNVSRNHRLLICQRESRMEYN